MLPRYRRLVERLAQEGKLRIICGTDTLGVGVNVPIRTVLFTKLCKYDGEKTKVLTVRDFKQIAGRAGRRGFDTLGSVVAQAPEHAIENKKLRAKAGGDPKKLRKLKMRQPPERGYAHWDAETFTRLQESPPEPLRSRFQVSNAMILNLFEREDNGCLALRKLIRSSHEGPTAKRNHARQAIAMIRSLRDAGVISLDADGPRVNEDFQSDFSLNQALSLYVVEAVDVLERDDAAYPLDVLTLVEATLEDPHAVLYHQTDTLKSRAISAMKAEGMEYEERMAELDKIEYPKPNAEFLYATYEIFSERHPWVGGDVLRPKSIARDMYELGMSFVEYVKEYGLQRSEGVLLRYLTDAYKGFVQTVPESAKTDELYDVSDWLGLTVRSVDASLLDEWEQLQAPDEAALEAAQQESDEPVDVTKDQRGFTTMVRNAVWKIVRFIAFKQYERAAEALSEASESTEWTAERFVEALAPYWSEYDAIQIGPDARSSAQVQIERSDAEWKITQILLDPDEHRSWHMRFRVDLAASREAAAPVLTLEYIGT
jgi:superfamily II RNA helicase